MMDKALRKSWIARGFKDPVRVYWAHVTSANQRGVAFKLTFEQWWGLWEPHYADRGRKAWQKVMCRNGDAGAYEVGNVRIATAAQNSAERGRIVRARNLAKGRSPTTSDATGPGAPADWMQRDRVFDVYDEEEEYCDDM